MGFSLNSIGRFIDGAYKVKREITKEASKDIDRNLKKVGKFIDNNYHYLSAADRAICGAASCVMLIVRQLIDLLVVKDKARRQCPNALKAQILEKRKNAVDVGIFSNGSILQKMTIQSEVGISNEIYNGQIIDLSC